MSYFVALIVPNSKGQVLAVNTPDGWKLPQVQVQPAETFISAVRRELLYSTGLEAGLFECGRVQELPGEKWYLHYLVRTHYGVVRDGSAWVSWDVLLEAPDSVHEVAHDVSKWYASKAN